MKYLRPMAQILAPASLAPNAKEFKFSWVLYPVGSKPLRGTTWLCRCISCKELYTHEAHRIAYSKLCKECAKLKRALAYAAYNVRVLNMERLPPYMLEVMDYGFDSTHTAPGECFIMLGNVSPTMATEHA